jgi:peroxiredoxin
MRFAWTLVGWLVSCSHINPPITHIQSDLLLTEKAISISTQTSDATVIVFLSPVCPCSLSHESSLAEMKKEHPQFNFVGIIPDHVEAYPHYQESKLPFVLLKDPKGALARQFQALKTPHVFVLGRKGEVLYRGAIDDSHIASGAKKFYLKEALLAISKGQRPQITETSPLGCSL